GLPKLLVRWEPYASFPSPGAWWIKIPLGFGPWPTVQEAQADIFLAVGPDPNPGPGYHPPPDNQAVYVPLFQPAFKNSWNGYLAAAKSNPNLAAPRLRAFT